MASISLITGVIIVLSLTTLIFLITFIIYIVKYNDCNDKKNDTSSYSRGNIEIKQTGPTTHVVVPQEKFKPGSIVDLVKSDTINNNISLSHSIDDHDVLTITSTVNSVDAPIISHFDMNNFTASTKILTCVDRKTGVVDCYTTNGMAESLSIDEPLKLVTASTLIPIATSFDMVSFQEKSMLVGTVGTDTVINIKQSGIWGDQVVIYNVDTSFRSLCARSSTKVYVCIFLNVTTTSKIVVLSSDNLIKWTEHIVASSITGNFTQDDYLGFEADDNYISIFYSRSDAQNTASVFVSNDSGSTFTESTVDSGLSARYTRWYMFNLFNVAHYLIAIDTTSISPRPNKIYNLPNISTFSSIANMNKISTNLYDVGAYNIEDKQYIVVSSTDIIDIGAGQDIGICESSDGGATWSNLVLFGHGTNVTNQTSKIVHVTDKIYHWSFLRMSSPAGSVGFYLNTRRLGYEENFNVTYVVSKKQ